MEVDLNLLRPIETELDERNLARLRWSHNSKKSVKPIEVLLIDSQYLILDGTHRAYVCYELQKPYINAVLMSVNQKDFIFYRNMIIPEITRISDLSSKILTHDEFKKRYLGLNDDYYLSDDEFFRKYPEVEAFCSYRRKK